MKTLAESARFTVTIDGHEFIMHRRSTFLMAQMGEAERIFGLIRGARAGTVPETTLEENNELNQSVLKVAMITPAFEDCEWPTLAPFADRLAVEFFNSGLQVDPTRESLKAKEEIS